MLCPNCRNEIRENIDVCPHCGVRFRVIIRSCGMPDFLSMTLPEKLKAIEQKIMSEEGDDAIKILRQVFVRYIEELSNIAGVHVKLESDARNVRDIVGDIQKHELITPEECVLLMECDSDLSKFEKKGGCVADAKDVFSRFREILDKKIVERMIEEVSKKPIETTVPDAAEYFSTNRKYYGKWAKWNIHSIPRLSEYLRLRRMANEELNVDAMLDLAIGFHNEERYWNNNMILNLPKGIDHRSDYAYDSVYYHYTVCAVAIAFEKWKKGNYEPPAHLATAIWETWLLWFDTCIKSVTPNMSKSFDDETLFPPGRNNWAIATKVFFDDKENRTIAYDAVSVNQYEIMDYISPLRTIYDDPNTMLPSNAFRDFTRAFFSKHPNSVAPVYEDAKEYTVVKLDFMYYIILAMRSEEMYCSQVQSNKIGSDKRRPSGLYLSRLDCDTLRGDFTAIGEFDVANSDMVINEKSWWSMVIMKIIIRACTGGTPSLGFLNSFVFLAEQRSNYLRWKVGIAVDDYPDYENSNFGIINKFSNVVHKIKSTF